MIGVGMENVIHQQIKHKGLELRRTGYDRMRANGQFCVLDLILVAFTGGLWILFMIDWSEKPISVERELYNEWILEMSSEELDAKIAADDKFRLQVYGVIGIFIIIITITIIAYHAHI